MYLFDNVQFETSSPPTSKKTPRKTDIWHLIFFAFSLRFLKHHHHIMCVYPLSVSLPKGRCHPSHWEFHQPWVSEGFRIQRLLHRYFHLDQSTILENDQYLFFLRCWNSDILNISRKNTGNLKSLSPKISTSISAVISHPRPKYIPFVFNCHNVCFCHRSMQLASWH